MQLFCVPMKIFGVYLLADNCDAVVKNFIEGVYITPGAESPLVWFGLLVVRTGIFYGGLFRFTITIPEEFPDTNEIPIVQFEESLFHPLINPKNNCVDLNRFFPSGWQRDRNHIYQVITATQGIFFRCQCDPSQAANPEASILLKENRSKFVQLAHNAVRFTPWDDLEMEPYRQYLLGKKELSENKKFNWKKHPIKNGLSWVKNEQNNSLFYLCDHFC
uniref:UBIQUITIN_CONJUGAT_2 domain-containing protein n=1 Tax=Meloidogyne hapla TaxID=6305 RepID=A0A1I8B2A9_MELHA